MALLQNHITHHHHFLFDDISTLYHINYITLYYTLYPHYITLHIYIYIIHYPLVN